MSQVTDLILITGLSENVEYLKEAFSKFKVRDNPFSMGWIDDKALPKGWYGGSKFFGANVLIGAYNYLDIPSLITFLRNEIKWEDPTWVQLLVQEHGEYKFKLIDLFPED